MKHKFRAWDPKKKLMVIDYDNLSAESYGIIWGENIHGVLWSVGKFYGTLMQYTGHNTEDGTEIYEDDIFQLQSDKGRVVRLSSGEYRVDHPRLGLFSLDSILDGKVIGNIHENPELLDD